MKLLSKSYIQYILGVLVSGGLTFLFLQYMNNTLTETLMVISGMVIVGVTFIIRKKFPYFGLGIAMAPLAIILFVALLIIEFTIHPPDEE